jgi:hypothetical protein
MQKKENGLLTTQLDFPVLLKTRINNYEKKLCFSFLVLWAQVLVTALSATCCANRIAGIAMHTYFHIE